MSRNSEDCKMNHTKYGIKFFRPSSFFIFVFSLAILIWLFLNEVKFELGDKQNKELNAYAIRGLSISNDGKHALFIKYSDEEEKLFSIDLDAENPSPKQVTMITNVSEVLALGNQSFLAVSRLKNSSKRNHYFLQKFRTLDDENPELITESDISINSLVAISDDLYAFKLGISKLPSGRPVSSFFKKGVGSPLLRITEKEYGYRYAVSHINNNLVFLSGQKDEYANEIPEVISLTNDAELPRKLSLHISRQLSSLGCTPTGYTCFSVQKFNMPGEGFYSHQLWVTSGPTVCKPELPYKWIIFPSVSQNGKAIAFFTTINGKPSGMNEGPGKFIVIRQAGKCKFEIQQINL